MVVFGCPVLDGFQGRGFWFDFAFEILMCRVRQSEESQKPLPFKERRAGEPKFKTFQSPATRPGSQGFAAKTATGVTFGAGFIAAGISLLSDKPATLA